MPVRSLTSSVLKWPDLEQIHQVLDRWVKYQVVQRPDIQRIGYFGSYARGDWGVGSDLDLIIIVDEDERPFSERSLAFDTSRFPLPVELIVYTLDEWRSLSERSKEFCEAIEKEAVWLYESYG